MDDQDQILDTNFVLELLNSWGVSEETQKIFKEQDIDGDCLEKMVESDIEVLIPASKIKDLIKFRSGLTAFKLESRSLTTCSIDNESVTSDFSSGNSEASTDVETTNWNKPKSANLKIILKSNNAGALCLASITKNNKLDSTARNNLVKSVIDYYMKECGSMNKDIFEDIATQIVELVPTELKETYYVPSQKFAKNKYIPARGKLVDKCNNQKRLMRKSGLIQTREHNKGETVAAKPDEAVDNDDRNVTEQEYEDLKLWLKHHKEPLNDVLDKWKITSKRRVQDLCSDKFSSIQDILQEWPSYRLSFGYKLIELDFNNKFPSKEIALFKKWPEFLTNALKHFKTIKAADKYIKILEDNPSEDTRDFCFSMLIGYKIVPTTRVQLKERAGAKKSYKPTITEALGSFILHATNQSEVPVLLDRCRDAQSSKGLRCQPIVIAVGPTIEELKEFYVSYDNILYKTDTFLNTLDTCFKAFHCFEAEYPIEAVHIWTFIQKYFYNMDLKADKKLSGVSSFISDLK